jgi:hypothetical protein
MRYDIVLAAGTCAETRLALYSSHMKSGSDSDDKSRRLLEAERIRDDAEALPEGWHFLLGGDFNIPSWGELAYQQLVGAQANDDGRFFDPINTPATWYNNPSYCFVHTQDPVWAMDDRFDQLLVSAGLLDGTGVDYMGDPSIPYSTTTWDDPHHSYRSWGNDGTSYDTPLTISGNQMVGSVIAQALENSAVGGGHLPVFLDFRIPQCLGDCDCNGHVDLNDFNTFAICFGLHAPTAQCPPEWFGCVDLNGDEWINLTDFNTFQVGFGACP